MIRLSFISDSNLLWLALWMRRWRGRWNAASLKGLEDAVFYNIQIVPCLICGLDLVGNAHALFHRQVVAFHSIFDLRGEVTDLLIKIGDHLFARGDLKFQVRDAVRALLVLRFSQLRFELVLRLFH